MGFRGACQTAGENIIPCLTKGDKNGGSIMILHFCDFLWTLDDLVPRLATMGAFLP